MDFIVQEPIKKEEKNQSIKPKSIVNFHTIESINSEIKSWKYARDGYADFVEQNKASLKDANQKLKFWEEVKKLKENGN